jgi:hypothetical protein
LAHKRVQPQPDRCRKNTKVEQPADLSFVQPIKFEFAVNLNAAWVGWPAKPLVLADDVVE